MNAKKSTKAKSNKKSENILKNPLFYMSIAIFAIIILLSILAINMIHNTKHKKEIDETKGQYIYIGNGNNIYDTESAIPDQIVSSYDEYTSAMRDIDLENSDKTLSPADFEGNNYALVAVRYDSCSEENIEPSKFGMSNGQVSVVFDYDSKCGFCAPTYRFYAFKLDKSVTSGDIVVNYHSRNTIECDPTAVFKPIIYLYPTKTTDVNVVLGHPELITTSYPQYQKGWSVTAEPTGELTDKKTGNKLYSLYWEGKNHYASVQQDGFIVKGKETAKFLEDKLSTLGLNYREAEEFIIYWLPKLEHNNYNYIRFETQSEIASYMPLTTTPKADTTIRVYMDYKPLDAPINIKEQVLSTPTRSGFTIVEWGGSEIK